MAKYSIAFIVSIGLFALYPFLSHAQNAIFCSEIDSLLKERNVRFPFGVASGDPRYTSVVLWTAVYTDRTGEISVDWELAGDSLFTQTVSKGVALARPENGFSVKVLVEDLVQGRTYYYRFRFDDQYSPTGRTRTAANQANSLSFCVVSCSNFSWGYFNAYAAIAKESNVQAVIHLGDYIYEYDVSSYKSTKLRRNHFPINEIVSIQDYRSRYAQYRLDADLQEAHRLHPFITIWDDHEIANDAYKDGAQNHQPETEGDWEIRKNTARKAYFEWLPIADNSTFSIKRNFSFGKLADLFMLDGRLEGRSVQLEDLGDSSLNNPSRTMLGKQQADWLIQSVAQSEARWKLIGNQVIFSPFNVSKKIAKYGKATDMWNGYPFERNRIMEAWKQKAVQDVLVFTGDVHCAFAFDLRTQLNDNSSSLGAEWVTTSVTSSNLDEYTKRWKVRIVENLFKRKKYNPHLSYCNLRDHGYLRVDIEKEKATAHWKIVEILKPNRAKSKVVQTAVKKAHRNTN